MHIPTTSSSTGSGTRKAQAMLSMVGDEAVTKGAENGFNAVYRCQSDAGRIRWQAHDCVMEVIHCLF